MSKSEALIKQSLFKLQNKEARESLYFTNANFRRFDEIKASKLIAINSDLFNKRDSSAAMKNDMLLLNEKSNFNRLFELKQMKRTLEITHAFKEFFRKVSTDLRKIDMHNIRFSLSEKVQTQLITNIIKRVKML